MWCALCVITDAGVSALLVGVTGLVAPVKDSRALSTAWSEMLSLDKAKFKSLSVASRERVVDEFSIMCF